jgi:hypothetical protein
MAPWRLSAVRLLLLAMTLTVLTTPTVESCWTAGFPGYINGYDDTFDFSTSKH